MTTIRIRRAAAAVAAASALLALSACSSSGSGSSNSGTGSTASASASSSSAITGKITVFAAASLQKSFTELGKEFQAAHPDTTVSFNFGGSDTLAASITSGAPADVFASASLKTMATVTTAKDNAEAPVNFVSNTLEIAVQPGNPKKITTLADLTKSGVKVALCAATVPCGATAVTALAAGGVKLTPVTYETDVTSALTKVESGSVDAALVYRTDVKGADGKVTGVPFAAADKAVTVYPIAPLTAGKNSATADAFVQFVLSAQGQTVLTAAGFQKP